MNNKATLTRVYNPFNRLERDVRSIDDASTLFSLKKEYIPAGVEVVCSINGKIIEDAELESTQPQAGDSIVFVPRVAGGDFGSILSMIAMIVISVYAPGAAGFLVGATEGFAFQALRVGIMMVGGMLVSALLPPPKPKIPSLSAGADTSPSFSFSPSTTQQEGLSVPRCYGQMRMQGNIISAFLEDTETEQYTNILIDMGRGEYANISSIRINDQPVESFSLAQFTGSEQEYYDIRLGKLNQTPLPAFADTKIETPLSILVTNPSGTPITVYHEIIAPELYRKIEIEITFPQGLYVTANDGNPTSYEISLGWRIEQYNETSKTWGTLFSGTDIFSRASRSPMRFTYTTPVYNFVQGTRYRVAIDKNSTDSPHDTWVNTMYLGAVRRVYQDDFTYPRHVLVALRVKASGKLSGSIRFSALVQGAKMIVFTGSASDTTTAFAWSDNPASVLFDLLTQPIFSDAGDGTVLRYDGIDPSFLDVQSFRDWFFWCEELLPDGTKRATFNAIFDSETTLWDAALKVCLAGRAMLVWTGAKLTVVIDQSNVAVQMFSVGNIIEGSFKESFLSMNDRAGEVEVSFINAKKNYTRDKVVAYDPTLKSSTKTTITALGVTSPDQAWRMAKFALNQNRYITRTVQFSVSADALVCSIGDIINVQHDVPNWGVGGRVVPADTNSINTITLDQEITIETGKSYVVMVNFADGTSDTRTVSTVAGNNTITVSTPFTQVPAGYEVFAFGESNLLVKPFRVLKLSRYSDAEIEIVASEYNESLYGIDTGADVAPTMNYSTWQAKGKATDLAIQERVELTSGIPRIVASATWKLDSISRWANWEVWEVISGVLGASLGSNNTSSNGCEWNAETGKTYRLTVTPHTFDGTPGLPVSLDYSASSTALIPPDVTGLKINITGRTVQLSWDASVSPLHHTYKVLVNRGTQSNAPADTLSTSTTTLSYPIDNGGIYYFSLYSVSALGTQSLNPAQSEVDATGAFVSNVVNTLTPALTLVSGAGYESPATPGLYIRPSSAGVQDAIVPLPAGTQIPSGGTPLLNAYLSQLDNITLDDMGGTTLADYKDPDEVEDTILKTASLGALKGYVSLSATTAIQTFNTDDIIASLWSLDKVTLDDFTRTDSSITTTLYVLIAGTWRVHQGGYVDCTDSYIEVRMISKNPLQELSISGVTLTEDVPDLNDSGVFSTSSLPFSGDIAFNRTFRKVTAVQASALGSGNSVVINSFTDTNLNVTILGSGTVQVSWMAQGY